MIYTAKGLEIDLENPSPEVIDIEDIATGLANLCRFGGQVNRFYSVAEHCCYMSQLMDRLHGIYGLMHDAHEAYLGDVISPLKQLINPHYKILTQRFDKAIYTRFELKPTPEIKKFVNQYDRVLFIEERRYLQQGHKGKLFMEMESMSRQPIGWPPEVARKTFLELYNSFTGEQV